MLKLIMVKYGKRRLLRRNILNIRIFLMKPMELIPGLQKERVRLS